MRVYGFALSIQLEIPGDDHEELFATTICGGMLLAAAPRSDEMSKDAMSKDAMTKHDQMMKDCMAKQDSP